MKNQKEKIFKHLSQLPFCKTFWCLLKKEKLEEGVMPKRVTELVNWCIGK